MESSLLFLAIFAAMVHGKTQLSCPHNLTITNQITYVQSLTNYTYTHDKKDFLICIECEDQIEVCHANGPLYKKLGWLTATQSLQNKVFLQRIQSNSLDKPLQESLIHVEPFGCSMTFEEDTTLKSFLDSVEFLACDNVTQSRNGTLKLTGLEMQCPKSDQKINSFTLFQEALVEPPERHVCIECGNSSSILICLSKPFVENITFEFPSLFHKCLHNCSGSSTAPSDICQVTFLKKTIQDPVLQYCKGQGTILIIWLSIVTAFFIIGGLVTYYYKYEIRLFMNGLATKFPKKQDQVPKITPSMPSETIFEEHELSNVVREENDYYDPDSNSYSETHGYYSNTNLGGDYYM